MLKYYILKQNSLRESNPSVSNTHAHSPFLQRSPHRGLICLEGSLHFSSEHYAGANDGDIHSALSFVTELRRDGEEETDGEG